MATISKTKEPVRLRAKKMKNGGQSLYLDYYSSGERQFEFLRLYLIPEKTKFDKKQNEETLLTANAVKAQRIVQIQNGEHGFLEKEKKDTVKLVPYVLELVSREGVRTSASYALKSLAYHLEQYDKTGRRLRDVDDEYIRGFIGYLRTAPRRSRAKKERDLGTLSPTTQALLLTRLSITLGTAVREKRIEVNPFTYVGKSERIRGKSKPRQYLTMEEVKKLAATDCACETIKRAFLFCCFCGVRYSDMCRLKWSDVSMNNGRTYISIVQKKTQEPLVLPLSQNAVEMLGKKGEPNELVFPFFPVWSSNVNRVVSRWVKDAGITKHITFHCSRHTNATLMLQYGADIYTVSKILGHTNVQTTQIYAKIVDENKQKAVDGIPDL